jgi:hypothetical protein
MCYIQQTKNFEPSGYMDNNNCTFLNNLNNQTFLNIKEFPPKDPNKTETLVVKEGDLFTGDNVNIMVIIDNSGYGTPMAGNLTEELEISVT